jgi:hypothetical protein
MIMLILIFLGLRFRTLSFVSVSEMLSFLDFDKMAALEKNTSSGVNKLFALPFCNRMTFDTKTVFPEVFFYTFSSGKTVIKAP